MTRDDIIRRAREVGAGEPNDLYGRSDYVVMTQYELERFAALVAAAEREACAKVCEETTAAWTQYLYNEGCMDCAKAIRARGDA